MSAAAARRRKQLEARKAAGLTDDAVSIQLNKILEAHPDPESMDETTAYEALQLAQSLVRKKVVSGQYAEACDLAYTNSLALLKQRRVSVASQLLTVLATVLKETHTDESPEWLDRIAELHSAHVAAMSKEYNLESADNRGPMRPQEAARLHRLQREWLRLLLQWSNDLGKIRYGNNRLHALLSVQCWTLARTLLTLDAEEAHQQDIIDDEDDELLDARCDAVVHSCLAENPYQVVEWLASLPAPTEEETKAGHNCDPAVRDGLLTRAVLCLAATENLRDAFALVKAFIDKVETRDMSALTKSYTDKNDGQAPSHVVFCCMLLRVVQKEVRTGALYSWLIRSFQRELGLLHKPAVVSSYTTRIGKIYFHIQPPPNALAMMENMMGMMGGGGGGINPAMMQAAMAQLQQGGMM
jgi:Golgi to ER traffic protein 4